MLIFLSCILTKKRFIGYNHLNKMQWGIAPKGAVSFFVLLSLASRPLDKAGRSIFQFPFLISLFSLGGRNAPPTLPLKNIHQKRTALPALAVRFFFLIYSGQYE